MELSFGHTCTPLNGQESTKQPPHVCAPSWNKMQTPFGFVCGECNLFNFNDNQEPTGECNSFNLNDNQEPQLVCAPSLDNMQAPVDIVNSFNFNDNQEPPSL